MTREEAIAKIGHIIDCIELGIFCGEDEEVFEALGLAIDTLRGPTREMVERMRGEWIKKDGYTECSKCEYWYDSPENKDDGDRPSFCPSCGAPMTDEALDMMLKRWKEAVDNA